MSRQPPTFMDLVVIALSPALIIALICSLTFFLVDLLYVGQYESRVSYTMFFFVIGAVLVARISIEMGHGRAAVYGLALAVVVWIALRTFLHFEPGGPLAPFAAIVDLGIMAVVWWSAHKLTWDCTFIDERRESASRGLLSAAGLEQSEDTKHDPDVIDEVEVVEDSREGFVTRWKRFREAKRKKPHTPGLWVIYFSLAALPIFGLGQSLIPSEEEGRRSYAFWLMLVYVGSGMGLLLTTSFLGLRRYLRQRNLQMPAKMTGTWLGLGSALIAVFLVIAAVLPRPYSETPIIDITGVDSEKRDASEYAQFSDSAGEGEGKPGEQSQPGDGKATADKGKQGGEGQGKGEKGSGSREGEKGSGNEKGGKAKSDSKSGSRSDQQNGDQQSAREADEREGGSDEAGNTGSSSMSPGLSNALEWVGTILKWAVFGLLLIVVLLFLFRNGLSWLANFMPWAKRWLDAWKRFWEGLFGGKETEADSHLESEESHVMQVPFAVFSNPFHDGSAGGKSPEELLRYTFAALEAWAREHGIARRENETAMEFTGRLGDDYPGLEEEGKRLGSLYARVAYAGRDAPSQTERILERFWDRLQEVNTAPVSA